MFKISTLLSIIVFSHSTISFSTVESYHGSFLAESKSIL